MTEDEIRAFVAGFTPRIIRDVQDNELEPLRLGDDIKDFVFEHTYRQAPAVIFSTFLQLCADASPEACALISDLKKFIARKKPQGQTLTAFMRAVAIEDPMDNFMLFDLPDHLRYVTGPRLMMLSENDQKAVAFYAINFNSILNTEQALREKAPPDARRGLDLLNLYLSSDEAEFDPGESPEP